MVAYSFQQGFEKPILTRRKRGTIRDEGKRRHARPGEEIQLYVGMRTRACRLIARATCLSVQPVRLYLRSGFIEIGQMPEAYAITDIDAMDAFAQSDGFDDWDEMSAFFWKTMNAHERLCLIPLKRLWIKWNVETLVTP